MRVAVFSTKRYDQEFLDAANVQHRHELVYLEARLTEESTALAAGFPAVCAFVHDHLNAQVLSALAHADTRLIVLRSAGFNNVDLDAAAKLGMTVSRVPAYSPHAVAEHTISLMLALDRKIHRAYVRVREGNFALDGLLGFDLNGRTAGVVGTGRIGAIVARLLRGFGCTVLATDLHPNADCEAAGVQYVPLDDLLARSDIITLHCPLTPETRHLMDADALRRMKRGVMLINTSRGALIDTQAIIEALKDEHVGYLGLDVYEEEAALFFRDLSNQVIQDDLFVRLLTFPNVIITGHQAFFTREALETIAATTLANVTAFAEGRPSGNELTPKHVAG